MPAKTLFQNSEDDFSNDDDQLLEKEDPSIRSTPPRTSTSYFRRHTALLTHTILFCVYLTTISLLVPSNIRLRQPTIITSECLIILI